MDHNEKHYYGRRGFSWYAVNLFVLPVTLAVLPVTPLAINWILSFQGEKTQFVYSPWQSVVLGALGLMFGIARIIPDRRENTMTRAEAARKLEQMEGGTAAFSKIIAHAKTLNQPKNNPDNPPKSDT